MLKIWLIRHGMTRPGEEHRYQGSLDEGLSEGGRADCDPTYVYVSPARRAVETAQILFPDSRQIPVPGLWEMDFGDFEGKTWKEMENDVRYRAWVDGGCTGTCPGGESRASFSDRVCSTFLALLFRELHTSGNTEPIFEMQGSGAALSPESLHVQLFPGPPEEQKTREQHLRRSEISSSDIFVVAHGGTQMALLERWGSPVRDYYSWQRPCGCGWLLEARLPAGSEESLSRCSLSSGEDPMSRLELRVLRELSYV